MISIKEKSMMKTICGANCSQCQYQEKCPGCVATHGRPFGGDCLLAQCCQGCCSEDNDRKIKECKDQIIAEFNDLHVKGMPEVKELFALNGFFVNLEYLLPNGSKVKLLNDNDIYLGNQLHKDQERCFGLVASLSHLLVVEYGDKGANPEILVYKKRLQ